MDLSEQGWGSLSGRTGFGYAAEKSGGLQRGFPGLHWQLGLTRSQRIVICSKRGGAAGWLVKGRLRGFEGKVLPRRVSPHAKSREWQKVFSELVSTLPGL